MDPESRTTVLLRAVYLLQGEETKEGAGQKGERSTED